LPSGLGGILAQRANIGLRGKPSSEASMGHFIDRQLVERANAMLLLGILGGAFAACAIAAVLYDIAYWLQAW
jgi:hypothetical protein